MRSFVSYLLCAIPVAGLAQNPPIDPEWSALRWYQNTPQHISRDPITGKYFWAVYTDHQGTGDAVSFPFLADGTDITPAFLQLQRFNVGSHDRLIDLSVRNEVVYNIMSRMSSSTYPWWWYLCTAPEDGSPLFVHNPGEVFDTELSDYASDLLVTPTAAYGCGLREIDHPDTAVAHLMKTDLQANLLWEVTWDDGPDLPVKGFSGVAVVGDTVVAMALPWMVFFDDADGALIGAVEVTQFEGDARCIAHGDRVYWTMSNDQGLYVGYRDLITNTTSTWSSPVLDAYGVHILVDQYDHIWVTTTTSNGTTWTEADDQGHWYRFSADLVPIDAGPLHSSVDDMCFVNNKISFTGTLDPATSTAYLITGTPQP